VGSELGQIKALKQAMEGKLSEQQEKVSGLEAGEEQFQKELRKDLGEVKEKVKSEVGNLKEENLGFLRELKRHQMLFKELQQEFQKSIEDKKKVNQEIFTTLGGSSVLNTTRLTQQVKEQTSLEGEQSFQVLLPSLKLQSNLAINDCTTRQLKLNRLFNEKKSIDQSGTNKSLVEDLEASSVLNLIYADESKATIRKELGRNPEGKLIRSHFRTMS